MPSVVVEKASRGELKATTLIRFRAGKCCLHPNQYNYDIIIVFGCGKEYDKKFQDPFVSMIAVQLPKPTSVEAAFV